MARFAAAPRFSLLVVVWACCLGRADGGVWRRKRTRWSMNSLRKRSSGRALRCGRWRFRRMENSSPPARKTAGFSFAIPSPGKSSRCFPGMRGSSRRWRLLHRGTISPAPGFDGKIRLWHLPSGRLQFTLTGHTNWITSLTFSPDGSALASAGYDKTVRLWDVETGIQTAQWEGHAGTVRTLAFSPDGKTLASAGDDGTFGSGTSKPASIKNFARENHSHPSGGLLDRTAKISDRSRRGQNRDLGSENEKSRAVVFHRLAPTNRTRNPQTAIFSPDGLSVLAGTRGGRVKIWSAANGKLIAKSSTGHDDLLTGLAVAADGKTLYTAGLDGTLQAWQAMLPLEPPLAKLPIPAGKVWSLSLSPDGNTLAVGGQGGFVELWDLTTGKRSRVLEGFDSTVDCLEYSPDGKLLAAASWRSKDVTIWNVETGEISLHLRRCRTISDAWPFRPTASSSRWATRRTPALDVFSLPDGKELRRLSDHGLPVYDVMFSPDGSKLASCSGQWTERNAGAGGDSRCRGRHEAGPVRQPHPRRALADFHAGWLPAVFSLARWHSANLRCERAAGIAHAPQRPGRAAGGVFCRRQISRGGTSDREHQHLEPGAAGDRTPAGRHR